jgi:hypothetical protein
MRSRLPIPCLLLLFAVGTLPSAIHAQAIPGTPKHAENHLSALGFNPASINNFIGANTFYNQPEHYTGTRAILTVVDAGHFWGGPNGHITLQHSTVRFDYLNQVPSNPLPINPNELVDPTSNPPQLVTELGEIDFHGTAVAHVAAGRTGPANGSGSNRNDPRDAGIAFGAELWSGATAIQWNGSLSFDASANSLYYPYTTSLITGVDVADGNGGTVRRTADVVNTSFGYSGDGGGASVETLAFDGIANQSGKTLVFSAGNAGTAGSISGPGNGYNSIVVGATAQGDGSFGTIASFSSRGPQRYVGPDGTVQNARARIDIVAPGSNLAVASYTGGTGGNPFRNRNSPNPPADAFEGLSGTSFSAPIVSGGATLLCDVGYDKFGGGNSVHANVIKAVLLNSADKLTGWNNGQSNVNGVITTTQALDFSQGAGQINLDRAFTQYTAGTTDVPGIVGGSGLETVGWDFGTVQEDGFNDYFFSSSLLGGSTFTATMNWFVGRDFNGVTFDGNLFAVDSHFINLDLEFWELSGGLPGTLIARSAANYINTEHFQTTNPSILWASLSPPLPLPRPFTAVASLPLSWRA